MSRTTASLAILVLISGAAGAAQARSAAPRQAAPAPPRPAATPRQPATAEVRAAYERSDALSRSVFWTDQADIDPRDPVAGVKAA
ncbi:MAG TPA: hypothetical protein VF686_00555, partial [Brevundimonas sp.]